jgi:hypothetical protein
MTIAKLDWDATKWQVRQAEFGDPLWLVYKPFNHLLPMASFPTHPEAVACVDRYARAEAVIEWLRRTGQFQPAYSVSEDRKSDWLMTTVGQSAAPSYVVTEC